MPICAAEPPKSSDGLSHPSIGGDPPSPGATLSGLQKERGGTPPDDPQSLPRPGQGPVLTQLCPTQPPCSTTDCSRADRAGPSSVLSPAFELRVEGAVISPLGVADGPLNSERKTAPFSISPG